MRPIAAIIESACDLGQLSRDIAKAHIEYEDGERALQAAEQKTESLRQTQQRRRLELGRKLIEAKAGVKHGGWLPFLEKLGIAARTAQEWMVEAGFIEETKNAANQDAAHLPSRVAAGIDKRPRKREEEPDPPLDREPEEDRRAPRGAPEEVAGLFASWKRDISRALVGMDKMIMGYAKSWPKRSRSDLARTLRGIAERIENMTED